MVWTHPVGDGACSPEALTEPVCTSPPAGSSGEMRAGNVLPSRAIAGPAEQPRPCPFLNGGELNLVGFLAFR